MLKAEDEGKEWIWRDIKVLYIPKVWSHWWLLLSFDFFLLDYLVRERKAENSIGTLSRWYTFTEASDIHLWKEVGLANYKTITLLLEILNAHKYPENINSHLKICNLLYRKCMHVLMYMSGKVVSSCIVLFDHFLVKLSTLNIWRLMQF